MRQHDQPADHHDHDHDNHDQRPDNHDHHHDHHLRTGQWVQNLDLRRFPARLLQQRYHRRPRLQSILAINRTGMLRHPVAMPSAAIAVRLRTHRAQDHLPMWFDRLHDDDHDHAVP